MSINLSAVRDCLLALICAACVLIGHAKVPVFSNLASRDLSHSPP